MRTCTPEAKRTVRASGCPAPPRLAMLLRTTLSIDLRAQSNIPRSIARAGRAVSSFPAKSDRSCENTALPPGSCPSPPGARRPTGPSRERRLQSMVTNLTPRALESFQNRLLGWFGKHRRDLPWRSSRDPYRVWLAEVMLQQTRIAAVIPYYDRFLSHFPSVESLARAGEDQVLGLWSGLGYYSRARNLHRAAKAVVARHNGQFPHDLEAALQLPGIGRYTAAAVLSIAYNVPFAALDANVVRVLARIGATRGDLRAPRARRQLAKAAGTLLARRSPGDWNQALMELGETICTPKNPRCNACPVARWCRAYAQKLTDEIPAPGGKRTPVTIRIAAAILCDPREKWEQGHVAKCHRVPRDGEPFKR